MSDAVQVLYTFILEVLNTPLAENIGLDMDPFLSSPPDPL